MVRGLGQRYRVTRRELVDWDDRDMGIMALNPFKILSTSMNSKTCHQITGSSLAGCIG